MSRTFFVLIIAFVSFACSQNDGGPDISTDVLVELLSELHLADSRMLLDADAPDSLRQVILDRHEISERDLDNSLLYLSEHPDELAELYTRVVDHIVETTE